MSSQTHTHQPQFGGLSIAVLLAGPPLWGYASGGRPSAVVVTAGMYSLYILAAYVIQL